MKMAIHFFNEKFFSTIIGGLAIALFAVSSAAAQAATFSGKHLQTGGQYQVAGDFNGDGRQDLALAGLEVEILLGLGDGNFQTGAKFPLVVGTAESPQSIIKGDFNGDGKFDLAVSMNAQNQVAVLLGSGDGTFQPQARYSTNSGATPSSVVTADFNRDGKADLMTTDEIGCGSAGCVVGRTVTLFSGNGDGTFAAPRQIDVGIAPSKAAVGDFNRDGIADAAIAASTGGKVFTLIGNGDGTFRQLPDVIVVATTGNRDVAVGDFNGDAI